jgi:UPF0716 family protein affecting phage T7 exclusion
MKIERLFLSSVILVALCVPAVQAQSDGSVTGQTIQQRKKNQQDRIANGVQSGQLTAGETKNLENKEANLNREERQMRGADNDNLTAADRAKLNRQQNRLSNQIYQDKHNANVAHYGNGQIGQRRENQQDRIAQGIRSGQLTPREAANLENKEQGLNREVSGMRQANGGKLSKADKQVVNQQQNKLSKQIYNKKHNGRTGY